MIENVRRGTNGEKMIIVFNYKCENCGNEMKKRGLVMDKTKSVTVFLGCCMCNHPIGELHVENEPALVA